jgi:hypothetical protein
MDRLIGPPHARNTVIKAGHGKPKPLIRPVRSFTTLRTDQRLRVMRALRKGQAAAFNITRDILAEARIVERAFGIGASALGRGRPVCQREDQREAA